MRVNKLINVIFILIWSSLCHSQINNTVYPTKNEGFKSLTFKSREVNDLCNSVKEFELIEKQLVYTNNQIVKITQLYFKSETEKNKYQIKIDELIQKTDTLVYELTIAQKRITSLNDALKIESIAKDEYQQALNELNFDFDKLKFNNYKERQLAFINDIKYRIEVIVQNLMKIGENINFGKNGYLISHYGELQKPNYYTDIQLKDCSFKMPSLPNSEAGFESFCEFIIYDDNGKIVQHEEIQFVLDPNANNPYTKTWVIDNDNRSNIKTIKLNDKIKNSKVDISKFKFLIVEQSVFTKNTSKFNLYSRAINEKIILSNDTELISKSLANLLSLTECTYTQNINYKDRSLQIKIYDTEQNDNDKILLYIGTDKIQEEIDLNTIPITKYINHDFFTTIRLSPISLGNDKDVCTLGLEILNYKYHKNLQSNESVCIEISQN